MLTKPWKPLDFFSPRMKFSKITLIKVTVKKGLLHQLCRSKGKYLLNYPQNVLAHRRTKPFYIIFQKGTMLFNLTLSGAPFSDNVVCSKAKRRVKQRNKQAFKSLRILLFKSAYKYSTFHSIKPSLLLISSS